MKIRNLHIFIFVVAILLSESSLVFAQEVSIELGRTEIGLNEVFQISATVQNDRLKEYTEFPEIQGFKKGRPSSSSSTNIINGKVSSAESITMNYIPTQQGTFVLKPFSMTINGKQVKSNGATIKVGAAVQRKVFDPFADFWGGEKQQEFVEIKDDAFFAVSNSKKEVYVGEGFTTDISFYVSLNNKATMDFYKIGEQLAEILKKIKPTNCWEENFGIESINPEYITINKNQYRQYKIYEAAYFPLNSQKIEMPSVALEMIKYKVAKTPTFFGRNKQEDFKKFFSSPKTVIVKELPDHPLKGEVSVGNFKLVEKINSTQLQTGKSVSYSFKIQGEGNISAIREPKIQKSDKFLFYPPSTVQNITRANSMVYGSKEFNFYIEPQEPGVYQLKDFIYWVYFNTEKEEYDTLKPEISLTVIGESKRNSTIAANDLGGFYTVIDNESNDLKDTLQPSWIKILTNGFIFIFLVGTALIVFWKKK
ncbi:MAG: BatD family protein [Flammeovirgaceae bacterium]